MKIGRSIFVFKKELDKLHAEIDITAMEIAILKNIFKAKPDDPDLYRPYKINKSQYSVLVKHKKKLESYSFQFFDFYIEAFTL